MTKQNNCVGLFHGQIFGAGKSVELMGGLGKVSPTEVNNISNISVVQISMYTVHMTKWALQFYRKSALPKSLFYSNYYHYYCSTNQIKSNFGF